MLGARVSYQRIFLEFIRLGCISFGGPIAAIMLIQESVCVRKRWISKEEFQETYTICKLLPGPIATEMAITMGRRLSGSWLGGVLSGLCFILPSGLIVLATSALYVHSVGTSQPSLNEFEQSVIKGLQIGALVVVALSVLHMSRGYWKTLRFWLLSLGVASATVFFPRWESLFIIALGLFGAWFESSQKKPDRKSGGPRSFHAFWLLPQLGLDSTPSHLPAATATLGKLFWVCFKSGAFVFGTGLAIVPILENDFVRNYHWVSHSQFMDGMVIGQVTPGPITIMATFLGFLSQGWAGAGIATLGIYLPAFFYALVVLPALISKMRTVTWGQSFYLWAIPGVIGGICAAGLHLSAAILTQPVHWIFAAAVLGLGLFKNNIPSWLLIPGSGAGLWLISLLLSKP